MSYTVKDYIKKAKRILDKNWTDSYTMPSSMLYQHQWNWDSGFIAIGYSRFDTFRAIKELVSLFKAQWQNGMLPHIVFNQQRLGSYFPEPDFWQTNTSRHAPKDILTSGITMPPVHAMAVLKIYERARNREKVLDFMSWIYPRLLKLHRYFYQERDPEGIGLVYIRHPWESGMDNSPMWDSIMKNWVISGTDIPGYKRADLSKGVLSKMRPTDRDYDRYVFLVELFRKLNYDERLIFQECPFVVYGPLFNSIVCASNEALVKISEILGKDKKEPLTWYEQTARAIREILYHPEHGMFDFYDLREKQLIDVDTAAGFLPLLCGAPTRKQAERLYSYLNSRSFCALHQGNCFSIPNYDTQREDFDRLNYWKGPVWININWLLMQGLRRYGYHQKADSVAKDILELPMRFGFYEYYDSFDGRGYGSKDFSWTAALFIDTAYETYEQTGKQPVFKRLKNKLWKTLVLNTTKHTTKTTSHRLSEQLLAKIQEIKSLYYTDAGTVDYDSMRISEQYRQYKELAGSLKEFDLGVLKTTEERLAFWINIYNSIVVDGIISLGIKSSVKEVMGFFTKIKYLIGGYLFSPDDIEHGILRANSRHPSRPFRQFGMFDRRRRFALESLDPRIHFALVCGSRSCAPIRFYTPEGIDRELEIAAKNFINSSEVVIIPEEKRVVLSMIFKWYQRDFGGLEGVLNFITGYMVDDDKREFLLNKPRGLKIDYLYYDWNLNR